MDPFQLILWCIALAFVITFMRPLVALFNAGLRGCIKSTRKTIQLIRN